MLRISIWLLSEKSNPLFVSAVEKEGLERAKTKESELNTVKQPNKSKTSNPAGYFILMAGFIHTLPYYDQKLRRSLHDATYNNPKGNEAPFYEVWDLWINDLILNERDYTCRPQGVLSVALQPEGGSGVIKKGKESIVKRAPDFIVYYSNNLGGDGESDHRSIKRDVAFTAEVKPWRTAMGEDHALLLDDFNDTAFIMQVRDHGKMILKTNGMAHVWVVQCLGMFWRVGVLKNENLSPFSKRGSKRKTYATHIEWGPIRKLGQVDSDVQQLDFWQRMSQDVAIN